MSRAKSIVKNEDKLVKPNWIEDVPFCAESCPYHDGKRCERIGFRPGNICEPAVEIIVKHVNAEAT